MRCLFLALAAGIIVAAPISDASFAARPGKKSAPAAPIIPREQRLTQSIEDDEAKLKTEKNSATRHSLQDLIEKARHELGPVDFHGKPVHPQAMWHDQALVALEPEVKRAPSGPGVAPATAVASDARLYVRRMARSCLSRGWDMSASRPNFQFDAYGAYLANNFATLDAMFNEASDSVAKESVPEFAGPARDAFLASVIEIKAGVERMHVASDPFVAGDTKTPKARDALQESFGSFHKGLDTVYQAVLTIRDLREAQKAAQSGVSAKAAPDAAVSAEEKTSLDRVRAVAAALGADAGWQPVRQSLEKFAAFAENGLQVSAARAAAQELLASLATAADLADGLAHSRALYPEYLAARQGELATALQRLTDRKTRQDGYSRIRRMASADRRRAILDASPLTPEAAQGILKATQIPDRSFPAGTITTARQPFRAGLNATFSALYAINLASPKEMPSFLQARYKEFLDVFLKGAEGVGRAPQNDLPNLAQMYTTVGLYAGDVERALRADRGFKAVAQHVPSRVGSLCSDFSQQTAGLVGNTSTQNAQQRAAVDKFLQPFDELASLRMPDPPRMAAANAFSGGTFTAAQMLLKKQIVMGLTYAAKNDSSQLDAAMDAQWMFRLLRHRAVAQADRLARQGVVNLDPLSVSDRTWTTFLTNLDQRLRADFISYADPNRKASSFTSRELDDWDRVYCWVAAAQRLTQAARRPGDSDLDRLMQNLAEAADPTPSELSIYGWAVGYHAVEAASALSAGFTRTAQWHLDEIRLHYGPPRSDVELSARSLDP